MCLLGQTQNGIYKDDFADVDPQTLHQFYGTTANNHIRHNHQTGAGHPPEEDSDDEVPILRAQITDSQQHHIHHEPIEVPDSRLPFPDSTIADLFYATLNTLNDEELVPAGYNILPEEMNEGYVPHEII